MTSQNIQSVQGRRVWDSRGRPTVQVLITLTDQQHAWAIAPAGASRGSAEATDLRDGDTYLDGLDVKKAVAAVNEQIAPALIGLPVNDQTAIDRTLIELDGTPNKGKLGGNAIVATSLAALQTSAVSQGQSLYAYLAAIHQCEPVLPLAEIQIFGGGAHAGRRVDVQDFMVMVPGADSFEHALEITAAIYHAAGKLMASKGLLAGVADEGGWWPQFDNNEQALQMLVQAIEDAGETPGDRVIISLDIAASEFAERDQCGSVRYRLGLEQREIDSDGLCEMLGQWLTKYPIASIEDPLAEDDLAGLRAFTQAYGDQVQIIGDDFLVTNAARVTAAAKDGACNAVLVKVNQAGTVTESLQTIQAARAANWRTIVSARSGETEDVTISHLATGLNAGQLKVGSFARSERMAKWNECLRIADQIGPDARFAGGKPLMQTAWGRRHLSPY